MILKRHQILSLLCLFCFTISACSQRNYQNRDETLAVVNDRSIRLEEFQKQLTPIQGFQGMDTRSISGKKEILDNMVTQELIFQEALKEGFHLENLEVKHAIVDQYLKKKFQADVERVTETDVKKYYDKYAQRLDRVRASILLSRSMKRTPSTAKPKKRRPPKRKLNLFSMTSITAPSLLKKRPRNIPKMDQKKKTVIWAIFSRANGQTF
ncbi:MAG: SurA N-terminal domain-containing protein [Bdellovibrionota bacterium]